MIQFNRSLVIDVDRKALELNMARRCAAASSDPVRQARVELWLEYRAKRLVGDEVSLSGFRTVGRELGLCS